MAKVFITEFERPDQLAGSSTQVVAITAGSVQSAALKANTTKIRIHTDAICSVEFGPNPTATADSARLAANSTESFLVPPGQAFKVAVITNT